MRRLFGTAGIRGRYLKKVSPELAYKVGASLATYLKGNKIVIGGDGRLTTPLLRLAAGVGSMTSGSNVIDIGLVPLPVLAWSIIKYDGDGGIYVTASHNPPTDNGLKVFNKEGMEFTEAMEIDLETLIFSGGWRTSDWDSVGKREEVLNAVEEYLNQLYSVVKPSLIKLKPKVLVDTANGAPSLATPLILKSMGAEVVSLNSNVDGRFPGRLPEPRPDVLEPFIPVAKSLGTHVFFAQDGDGDRLAVIDPKDGFIKQDRIIALIAKHKLEEKKGTVIVSIDCGNAVRDVVSDLGGKLAVVKLGKTHEGILRFNDALIAAEPWKLIDPSWGKWIDGIYQAALITKLMMETGKTIGELMSEIPNYPQARYSIATGESLKESIYEVLVNELKGLMKGKEKVLEIDGFRVDFADNSWILIRKSGTEPKVRIYGEAKSVKKLEEIIKSLIGKAVNYARSKGYEEIEVEGKIIP